MKIREIVRKGFVQSFLAYASLFITLTFIGTLFFIRSQSESSLERLQRIETNKLQLQVNEIINDFKFIQRDVLFLRDLISLKGICSCSDRAELKTLEDELTKFLNQKKQYDQLRLIDHQGMEQIRIQNISDETILINEDLLQDKSDRYYFKEITSINNLDLYFSKFDLNVENNKIEIPHKPVMRIGMKIANCEDDFCGIVLINYLGQALIDRLNSLNLNAVSSLHLTDPQGFFLISPNEEQNWGFMTVEGSENNYAHRYQEAWETIQINQRGQTRNHEGLFTFETITFDQSETGLVAPNLHYFARSDFWKIISFVPSHELDKITDQILSSLYLPISTILLLSVILAYLLSYYRAKDRKAKQEVTGHNEFLSNVINSIADPFYVLSAENGTVQLSNQAAQALNILEGDNIKKSIIHTSGNNQARIDHFRKKIVNSEKSQRLEIETTLNNGSIKHLEIDGYPVLDKYSRVHQVIEVVSNKTAEKTSEKKFKDLLASAPDGMIITNKEGTIEMVNKRAQKLFEYSEEELLGKKIEILIPKRFSIHGKYRNQYSKNPSPRTMGSGLELYGLKSTGEEFPIEISLSPIQTNEGILFSSAIRDITERKLIQEEVNKLAMVAKHTSNSVIITDISGQIEWVNHAFELLTENDQNEVIGKKLENVILGVNAPKHAKERIYRAFSQNKELKIEVANSSKTGKEYWQSLTIQPIGGQDKSKSKFICLGIDVTERKKIENALKTSEKILKLFVKNNPTAIAMFDTDMRYLVASDKWYSEYKIKSTNIIGKSHYEVFPEIDSNEEWKDIHKRCLNGEIYKVDEDFFIREDGTRTWLRYEIHPWHNDASQIGGIIMFTEDITDRKEIEKEVFDQAQILSQIVESVVATDLDGNITFWNKGAENLFGYAKDEIIGKHIEIIYAEENTNIPDQKTVLADDQTHHILEIKCSKKSKETFWGYMSVSPQRDLDGNVVGMINSIIDITENKKYQEELKHKQQLLNEAQRVAQLGSFDWNIPNNKVTWSDEVFNIFGVDQSTYQESFEKYLEFIPSDDIERVKALISKAFITKNGFKMQHKIVLNDGALKYIDLICHLELDEIQEVKRIYGTVLDITESKLFQKELETKQFFLNEAQRIAQLGSWQWDLKNDKYTWSDELYNICGLIRNKSHINHNTFFDLMDPEESKEASARLLKAIERRMGYTARYKIQSKNGTSKFIDFKVNVELDSQGSVAYLNGTALDITHTKITQDKLERNQFLLNEAQKTAQLGSWEWDFTLNKLTCSDELYHIYGLNPAKDHIDQHNFISLSDIDEKNVATESITTAIKNKTAFRVEHKIKLNDGTIKYIDSKGDVGLNENGEVTRIYGTALDITAIKKAQEEIRKLNENLEQKVADRTSNLEKANKQIAASEKKTQLLKEIASTAYAAHTKEEVYEIAIQKFSEYINWPVGKLFILDENSNNLILSTVWHKNEKKSNRYNNLTPLENLNEVSAKVKVSKRPLFIEKMHEGGNPKSDEVTRQYLKSVVATPVIIKKEVVAVMAFYHTEEQKQDKELLDTAKQIGIELSYVIGRKQAEKALKESEEKFRQLAENIDQVLWLSADSQLLYMSPSYEKVFERKLDEIYRDNQSIFKSIHPDDVPGFVETYAKNYLQGNFELEFRLLLSDGRIKWIKAKIFTFVSGDEQDKRSVGIAEDITELKKLSDEILKAKDEAEKANKIKSEFLANMSHEIRTPMNAIIGFSEQLSNTVRDQKQLSQINSIRSSGKNLLRIINDILDLSKIEAGKLEIHPAPVNIYALAMDMKNVFEQKVQEKGIYLRVVLDQNIPETVLIDEARIRQILFNLIGNAVKFTDKGHVILSFQSLKFDNKNKNVDIRIQIEDTGIGIPVNQHKLIFDPFSQQSGQSVIKYGGTGLGLSITKKLVEAMGGTISLESKVGSGSKFFVNLSGIPVSDSDNTYEEAYGTSMIIFQPATVLVVDDITANRALIIDLLENSQLTIHEAVNGQEAVELATEQLPDLILMDLRMPVMDGYTAAEILRNQEQTKAIPIMAVTASVKNLKGHEKSNLFHEYLLKPLDITTFFKKLQKYLNYKIQGTSDISYHLSNEKISHHLTGEQRKILPELISNLKANFLPRYEKAIEDQVIDEIEKFGNELHEKTRKFNHPALVDYCEDISNYVDSFEFDKLMSCLKRFPGLIESLKEET